MLAVVVLGWVLSSDHNADAPAETEKKLFLSFSSAFSVSFYEVFQIENRELIKTAKNDDK